jgi:hypothetical protein
MGAQLLTGSLSAGRPFIGEASGVDAARSFI